MLGFSSLSETPLATLSGDGIRIESSASLDSTFLLSPELNVKYFPRVDLNVDWNILSSAINRSNISGDLLNEFELAVDSLIRIPASGNLQNSSLLLSDSLIKIVNSLDLSVNSILDSSSLLKVLGSANLNVNSIVDGTISSISFNGADLQVIAVIDANFSRVNGDIVYYVVYADKIKPFNMNIVRVKK